MPHIGLTEAAKLTGKNKTTIHRAMENGTLSHTVGKNGQRLIDPAELERVFPIRTTPECLAGAESNRPKPPSNHAQLAELRAQLEAERVRTTGLQERLADKDAVIEDLRTRLDAEAQERRRTQAQLTALLTDQRQKQELQRQPRPSLSHLRRWWPFGKPAQPSASTPLSPTFQPDATTAA